MRDGQLFRDGELRQYLEGIQASAVNRVAAEPADNVRFIPEVVAERIWQEHRLEPVSFDFEAKTRTEPREETEEIEQWGERYTIPIQVLSIIVPMTGDPELLRRQPSTYTMGPTPEAFVRGDAIVFSVRGRELTPEAVHGHVEAMKTSLEKHILWANNDVATWDTQMRIAVTTAVQARKQRLDEAASLSAGLDIPLAPTSGSSRVTVPVARKRVRLEERPPASGVSARLEPSLDDAVYEDVLRTLGGLARALERLPKTASRFNEVELRDLALFILNSGYEGAARGEVFNGNGKTDILLPWKDRNAFIGECKFWKGPKGFTNAIAQLMGYLVWQDTKAALILFIRGGEPSEIIEEADKCIRVHESFRSAATPDDPFVRRNYVMASTTDSQRYVKLAFLPVVVPE